MFRECCASWRYRLKLECCWEVALMQGKRPCWVGCFSDCEPKFPICSSSWFPAILNEAGKRDGSLKLLGFDLFIAMRLPRQRVIHRVKFNACWSTPPAN